MRTVIIFVLAMIAAFTGTANAQWGGSQNTPSAGVYGNQSAMRSAPVKAGVVVQVRPVHIEASQTATWTGRGSGAALGAMLGSRVGGGNGQKAAMILGGVLGAAAGDQVAEGTAGYNAQEVIVAVDDGSGHTSMFSVTQAGSSLAQGMRVFVVGDGWSGTRVVPANSAM